MNYIYREYGMGYEVTEYEKKPFEKKVRIFNKRSRSALYGARRSDNLRRLKGLCMRKLLSAFKSFGVPLFATLTFSGDASDVAVSGDSLRRFFVRLQVQYPGSACFFIPEVSPRGRIHYHGFIFGLPLSYGDVWKGGRVDSYGSERSDRKIARLWGVGFVDLRQVEFSRRLVFYVVKYLGKSFGSVLLNGTRLVRSTRNIGSGLVIRGDVAREIFDSIDSTPDFVYSSDHPYLGKVVKSFYTVDNFS